MIRKFGFASLFMLLHLFRLCSSLSPGKAVGSAAKPYQKQKIAVFGAGGYLGGLCYGFLQRAGSLYGTGIADISSPRAITATASGSVELNRILGKNFILAQADESFVKLTDMSSASTVRSRVEGFDAVVLATRYTLEKRPVTPGSYDKTPNSKTLEFYLDRPRSSTIVGYDDPETSFNLFKNSVEACRDAGIKRIVVIETDGEFGEKSPPVGSKYLDVLKRLGMRYAYIIPTGRLENFQDYTHAKGVLGDLNVELVGSLDNAGDVSSGPIYREDLASLACQSLLSLDWNKDAILRVGCTGLAQPIEPTLAVSKEWCVNSNKLEALLGDAMLR